MAEFSDGNVYLVMSLRNVGAGIGVCQGWCVRPGLQRAVSEHVPEEQFRAQMRDLYISGGDTGLWQGAIRDANDPSHGEVAEAVRRREPVAVELLYSDQVGGQRTISRFSLIPFAQEEGDQVSWIVSGTRHWYLDWDGPRPESVILEAIEAVQRDRDVAERRRRGLGLIDGGDEDPEDLERIESPSRSGA